MSKLFKNQSSFIDFELDKGKEHIKDRTGLYNTLTSFIIPEHQRENLSKNIYEHLGHELIDGLYHTEEEMQIIFKRLVGIIAKSYPDAILYVKPIVESYLTCFLVNYFPTKKDKALIHCLSEEFSKKEMKKREEQPGGIRYPYSSEETAKYEIRNNDSRLTYLRGTALVLLPLKAEKLNISKRQLAEACPSMTDIFFDFNKNPNKFPPRYKHLTDKCTVVKKIEKQQKAVAEIMTKINKLRYAEKEFQAKTYSERTAFEDHVWQKRLPLEWRQILVEARAAQELRQSSITAW